LGLYFSWCWPPILSPLLTPRFGLELIKFFSPSPRFFSLPRQIFYTSPLFRICLPRIFTTGADVFFIRLLPSFTYPPFSHFLHFPPAPLCASFLAPPPSPPFSQTNPVCSVNRQFGLDAFPFYPFLATMQLPGKLLNSPDSQDYSYPPPLLAPPPPPIVTEPFLLPGKKLPFFLSVFVRPPQSDPSFPPSPSPLKL